MNKIKEIFVIFLFLIFCINSSNSTIKDSIIGTVGDKPVTSSDLIKVSGSGSGDINISASDVANISKAIGDLSREQD